MRQVCKLSYLLFFQCLVSTVPVCRSRSLFENFYKFKKQFKFLKKNYIGSYHFVVFYVQKCLFPSFSRLRSPLRALKK